MVHHIMQTNQISAYKNKNKHERSQISTEQINKTEINILIQSLNIYTQYKQAQLYNGNDPNQIRWILLDHVLFLWSYL